MNRKRIQKYAVQEISMLMEVYYRTWDLVPLGVFQGRIEQIHQFNFKAFSGY